MTPQRIPARRAVAIRVQAGHRVEVVNPHGLVLSACPQDVAPANGAGLAPTDADFRVTASR
jgi:uncharacterized protein YcgI (DUF1989 family)